jgi:glucose-1-phosphate cytidylyltransferase
MDIYAAQGHTDFVLAGGYLVEEVEKFATGLPDSWTVAVVDTGEDTATGTRVALCRRLLGETFFVTYGDGVGDVDLDALVRFHRDSHGAATVTTVPLPSPYGTLEFGDGDAVERFVEKPLLLDHWINAGFFVFEQRAFEHWFGDDLERQVLPALAAARSLHAYRHSGFWRSLDTHKDSLELSQLCEAAYHDGRQPPWLPAATRVPSS